MKKELSRFLKAKAEVEKKLGRGAVVSIAEKRGVNHSAISRWFSAKRFTEVDKQNMTAALELLEEKRQVLEGMTKAAIRA